MVVTPTGIPDAFLVEPKRLPDDRGFFARTWCDEDAVAQGSNPTVAQCNVSFNPKAGTLRGMHFQEAPHAEAKLVRCTAGAVFDVFIDLRPSSPMFKRWDGGELTVDNHCMLYCRKAARTVT